MKKKNKALLNFSQTLAQLFYDVFNPFVDFEKTQLPSLLIVNGDRISFSDYGTKIHQGQAVCLG